MSRATPQMRHFAQRLIVHEARAKSTPKQAVPASFRAFEKIHPHLATLMGNAGFQALLARAHSIAIRELPGLRTVQVNADGSLKGLNDLEEAMGSKAAAHAAVTLLAQLLGLLVAFIGEPLTLKMMQEMWPKLSVRDLDVGGRPR